MYEMYYSHRLTFNNKSNYKLLSLYDKTQAYSTQASLSTCDLELSVCKKV